MDEAAEMPRYQCHKKVWALKIKGMAPTDAKEDGSGYENYLITPSEGGYAPFKVGIDYMRKHDPQVGGYYVVYDDGYKSFSPAKAFEEGYTRV